MLKNEMALKISKLREDSRENVLMNSTVNDTVGKILEGVEGRSTKLQLNKAWVEKKVDNKDVAKQQEYVNSSKIWADELRADVSLIDKETGKVIDKAKNIKVATIPKITDRASYSIIQSRLVTSRREKSSTDTSISQYLYDPIPFWLDPVLYWYWYKFASFSFPPCLPPPFLNPVPTYTLHPLCYHSLVLLHRLSHRLYPYPSIPHLLPIPPFAPAMLISLINNCPRLAQSSGSPRGTISPF